MYKFICIELGLLILLSAYFLYTHTNKQTIKQKPQIQIQQIFVTSVPKPTIVIPSPQPTVAARQVCADDVMRFNETINPEQRSIQGINLRYRICLAQHNFPPEDLLH